MPVTVYKYKAMQSTNVLQVNIGTEQYNELVKYFGNANPALVIIDMYKVIPQDVVCFKIDKRSMVNLYGMSNKVVTRLITMLVVHGLLIKHEGLYRFNTDVMQRVINQLL